MNQQIFDNDIYGIRANYAAQFANRASELIRQLIADKHEVNVQTKSSINDLVTDIDRRSETLIRELIAEHFPEDMVLAEEGIEDINPVKSDSNTRWIVDPLDGTANFVYQVPAYGVSIACEIDSQIVAGAVVDISNCKTYVAAKGHGAYLISKEEKKRLACRCPDSIEVALLATGFSSVKDRRQRQAKLFAELAGGIRDIRRFGAAAIDICRVASGEVDGYYEHGISGWDYAAGSIIAQEAGAIVITPNVDLPSTDGNLFLACSPSIHLELTDLLAVNNAIESL